MYLYLVLTMSFNEKTHHYIGSNITNKRKGRYCSNFALPNERVNNGTVARPRVVVVLSDRPLSMRAPQQQNLQRNT